MLHSDTVSLQLLGGIERPEKRFIIRLSGDSLLSDQ